MSDTTTPGMLTPERLIELQALRDDVRRKVTGTLGGASLLVARDYYRLDCLLDEGDELQRALAAAEARAAEAAAEAGKWKAEARAHAARFAVLEKADPAPYCEGQCGICDCETAPVAPQQQLDASWEVWHPAADTNPSSDLTVIVRAAPGKPKFAAYYRKETDTWFATSGRKMAADEITQWRYQAGK